MIHFRETSNVIEVAIRSNVCDIETDIGFLAKPLCMLCDKGSPSSHFLFLLSGDLHLEGQRSLH